MLIGLPIREAAGLYSAVVLLDMFARPSNGQQVEQSEVVKTQHLDEARWGAFHVVEVEPAVELLLCEARGAVDAADTVIEQSRIVAFRGESDLVTQVRHAVIDRRRREHEHARLDALLDDLAHQAVVARFAADSRGLLVAEIV
jgi:hypothetical protein